MINTTIAMAVSWLAGYIVYKSRAGNFSSQKEVEAQSAKLEALNLELEDLNAELNIANKKLEYLSQTDGLTGIYNRRMFDQISSSFWEKCRKCCGSLAVIMIDIDHFKLFNDTYGHQKGDECLKSIVAKIKELIPDGSVLARYGGEEFAILVENCSMSEALDLAENIRAKVAALKIPHENSQVKPYVTLSLGVYCASPGGDSISEFIGFADKSLYKAKEDGRDRVAVM
jgi:diguanylate cyclase (GGDEF)-like protein